MRRDQRCRVAPSNIDCSLVLKHCTCPKLVNSSGAIKVDSTQSRFHFTSSHHKQTSLQHVDGSKAINEQRLNGLFNGYIHWHLLQGRGGKMESLLAAREAATRHIQSLVFWRRNIQSLVFWRRANLGEQNK